MSQIAFPLTGPWNVVKPLQYVAQTSIDAIPTASPSFTAAAINGDLRLTVDHRTVDVRQLGDRHIYSQIAVGHDFGFGFSLNPYNLPLLKYGSEEPNETTPTGTSAEYLGFVFSQYQALGGSTLSEYYYLMHGAKCNTLEMSVNSSGLVEANMEWMCRSIDLPTTSHGLTTPTFISLAGISSAPLSHVDNGSTPLTIDGDDFACSSFRINWNNNLIADRFNGSDKVDALTVGNREVTGSAVIPVGTNLNLETDIRTAEQTAVTGSYTFKSGVMVVTMTELETLSYGPAFSASGNDTSKWEWNFKCKKATLATS